MRVTVDTGKMAAAYKQAFKRLYDLPGFDHQQVVRGEMAIILKAWAGRTKVSTAKRADARAHYITAKRVFGDLKIGNNRYGISINTGARGGTPGTVWLRTSKGRFQLAGYIDGDRAAELSGDRSGGRSVNANFVASWTHFKTGDWEKIRDGAGKYSVELNKRLRFAPASVGIARQSIIQASDQLGIDLSKVQGTGVSPAGITKARAAIASNGQAYTNGSGQDQSDEVRTVISAVSRLPYAIKAGMDVVLAHIMAGRAKYIAKAYEKGAFTSIKKACAAFPNILAPKF